jgi:hypothetical protein
VGIFEKSSRLRIARISLDFVFCSDMLSPENFIAASRRENRLRRSPHDSAVRLAKAIQGQPALACGLS